MLTQHFQATISPGPNELTLLPEETFLLLQQLHTCLFFQRVTSLVQSIEQLHTQHDTHTGSSTWRDRTGTGLQQYNAMQT